MTTIHEVTNNVRASYDRATAMSPEDRQYLERAADHMWATLPSEYQWLKDWERV